ncbi:alpha/beta fold hydrolase [Nocardiopsis sp. CNT-189]|uniref:alpha/beta hydrolase n=1 Tax=Nocardiopsis oceanisediminis TaxID=2816862 RepID=UPI003B2AC2C3
MKQPLRQAESLLRLPGVRTVPRPVHPDGDEVFDLGYAREGTPGGVPLLVVPGGPGLASVLPYRMMRRDAGKRGFDTVMVEHRGVGLSRRRRDGTDLPVDAITVEAAADDIAAVLDDCGLGRAVVWGSSYGGYLAQVFAARHGDRVAGMVLDSAIGSAADGEAAREHIRRLLWDGSTDETAEAAGKLRKLVADGAVTAERTGRVVPVVYEFGGVRAVDRLLEAAARGRTGTWNRVERLAGRETAETSPFILEYDLAGAILFRNLHRMVPDGGPLDPAVDFADMAERFPAFEGETVDLDAARPDFAWPTAVLSGARDLRAVRPVAERTAERIPDAELVPFADSGHSFLDRFRFAGLLAAAAVANGRHHDLPGYTARAEALRGPNSAAAIAAYISASLAVDERLPRRR